MTPDEKTKLFKILEEQTSDLQDLKRGMYGDKANGVKGLLDRVKHIESWITASKMKIAYISGGIGALVIGLKMAWEWLVEHVKKG